MLTSLATLAAAALVTVVMVVASGALGADRASAGSGRAPVEQRRAVLVQPGDTLWSIAAEVDGEADRRDVIEEIVRVNGLPSSQVAAGQTLVLPTR